jgi:hypothetical protein
LIMEPDGSSNDDFVIPDRTRNRVKAREP